MARTGKRPKPSKAKVVLARVIRAYLRLQRRTRIIIMASTATVFVAVVLLVVLASVSGSAQQASSLGMPAATYSETTPMPTPIPTPVPTTTPVVTPDPTLQRGDENEKVQKLQERLMDLGYLAIDETTQFYGPATETAVTWFQRQIGLDMTGIADGLTQDWLYSDDAKPYTLLEETSGSDVSSLQRRLNDLGYLDKVTGYYGTETVQAVKDFQKANKLMVDGKTGENTLNKIYSPNAVPTPEKRREIRSIRNYEEMIEAAEAKLGCPYVSGAEGPSKFDCSGLVYWCLKQAGSNRGRYNAQGYASVDEWGERLSWSQLKRGDLMFFHVPSRNKTIGHVAIYLGNGMIIDASSSNGKVVKRSCTSSWFTTNFRWGLRPW